MIKLRCRKRSFYKTLPIKGRDFKIWIKQQQWQKQAACIHIHTGCCRTQAGSRRRETDQPHARQATPGPCQYGQQPPWQRPASVATLESAYCADLTTLNVHLQATECQIHEAKTGLNRAEGKSAIPTGYFRTHFTVTERTRSHKMKGDHLDRTGMYKTHHPKEQTDMLYKYTQMSPRQAIKQVSRSTKMTKTIQSMLCSLTT